MSNPYSALQDSSSDEGSDSEQLTKPVDPQNFSSSGHEGGMRVALEQSTSDEFPLTPEDIDVTLKVLNTIGNIISILDIEFLRIYSKATTYTY